MKSKMMHLVTVIASLAALALLACLVDSSAALAGEGYRVAIFNADVTIPIGHACVGGAVKNAKKIADPLYAKGFVLLGAGEPIVVIAVDWCQMNNDSFERWRTVLAEAAGTTPKRIILTSVHEHDAPIFDLTAQELLTQHGLKGASCDPEFHEQALQRTAKALKESLATTQPITHFGAGQAKVEKVACNRRVITPKGKIAWTRGGKSGDLYGAPEGEIDPWLKTISLWNGDRAVLAWSCYGVHPMSNYGHGEVSTDFVGMARQRRQKDDPSVFQMYFTGCCGDTTAGKYHDTDDPKSRSVLADRLYQAMVAAWKATERRSLDKVTFRSAELSLPPRVDAKHTIEAMNRVLANASADRWLRIEAAFGLSWRKRLDAGQPIDVPCLDLGGHAEFMTMPGETFVAYQLIAQRLRPECFVMVAAFSDGAPGYIPTDQCWKEGFTDTYCWIDKMTEKLVTRTMAKALGAPAVEKESPEK